MRMASGPVCRSIEPLASRMPTLTATTATDKVASSSSAAEERKAMRSVSTVARRCRWLTSPMVLACRCACHNRPGWADPHDVEEVTRQGRRGLPPPGGRVLGGPPDQRGEQGSRGTVTTTTSALTRSTNSKVPTARTGSTTPATRAGR